MSAPGPMGRSSPAAELRPKGPVELVDRGLLLARHGGLRWVARAACAGLPLGCVCLGIFYLERVEGIRQLRPLGAALLVAAWWARALGLRTPVREAVQRLSPAFELPAVAGRGVDVVRTASWVGLGLGLWMWVIGWVALLSPLALVAMVLPLAARGLVAPSWLARTSCTASGGLRAYRAAVDDTQGARVVWARVELLTLAGLVGLYVNLYALMRFGLLLGQSMLGFDVALVQAFISTDNRFVLLCLAVVVVVLAEPLRAALSALAFVEARTRHEGLDLRAAVDRAIALRSRSRSASRAGARIVASLCLVSSLSMASAARAQDHPQDATVRQRVQQILERDEFAEFAGADTRPLADLFDRMIASFSEWFGAEEDAQQPPPAWLRSLPPPAWLVVTATLVLLVLGLHLWLRQRAPASRASKATSAAATEAHSPGPAAASLQEAARLAALGRTREAIRALYLATLSALDQRQLIVFDPAKTNRHYLAQLPRDERRERFRELTGLFDRTWYGGERASVEQYEACRELVAGIVERGGRQR